MSWHLVQAPTSGLNAWGTVLQAVKALEPKNIPVEAMKISAHWVSYVHGAFALANAFGPAWVGGKPYSRPGAGAAVAPATDALAKAMRTPPSLTRADAHLLSTTGQNLWHILRRVADGDIDSAASLMNELLERGKPYPRMARHGPAGNWHLHFTTPEDDEGALWATDISVATAILVGSEDFTRVGSCQATKCEIVFLDQTRNRSQQFCSKNCQDRAKAAALRSRRKEAVR